MMCEASTDMRRTMRPPCRGFPLVQLQTAEPRGLGVENPCAARPLTGTRFRRFVVTARGSPGAMRITGMAEEADLGLSQGRPWNGRRQQDREIKWPRWHPCQRGLSPGLVVESGSSLNSSLTGCFPLRPDSATRSECHKSHHFSVGHRLKRCKQLLTLLWRQAD